ncbi:hypothetical protein WA026_017237 [Henosepilachna vigintioctopunctata]|uniref:Nitric oxide-associated protein 1 n=1 Tax=Henosepilachna vigintioctopunctata TaxID=420089 RepID=A0AAW1UFB9_9CUCU
MQEIIRCRNELLKEQKDWMLNYDNFDDTLLNEETLVLDGNINYGTPDPKTKISKVPCGGCGAHLHCKDPSIPGYLPSEIFKNSLKEGGADLTALICQRCYFLKHHNIALDVQVTAEDYPKILQTISSKEHAIIVLMVDLTDFPCSIWPGIADIFYKKPIIVVGNKVDLLPKDSPGYLQHIKNKLIENVKAYGFGTTRLIDVLLISATTGYGIEKLITQLYHSWRFKGDVYLVGSTNVGKSSLFNALLQSDFCKSQAEDLIQRATTSIWPGTTLNLLKFPIAKPSGHKLEVRKRRLRELERLERHESALKEEQMLKTKDWKYSVLVGRIDRSVTKFDEETANSFAVNPSPNAPGRIQLGVNMKDPIYALSRWCYDTPGVVHSDHIVHLLTSEELFLTVPKVLIFPKTFILKPGESLFIAGLARLDLLEGDNFIRLTVFCSRELPISVCKSEEAQQFYEKYLGTEYLKVPSGGAQRLSKWPGLSEAKTFTVNGIDSKFSAQDVVLSNAGWIAITGGRNETFKLKAWTPEKRGVHLRDCLLPQAVNQRGPKMRSYPTYHLHEYYQEND